MCENWRKVYFNKYSCEGTILDNGSGDIIVKGKTNLTTQTQLFYFGQLPKVANEDFLSFGDLDVGGRD